MTRDQFEAIVMRVLRGEPGSIPTILSAFDSIQDDLDRLNRDKDALADRHLSAEAEVEALRAEIARCRERIARLYKGEPVPMDRYWFACKRDSSVAHADPCRCVIIEQARSALEKVGGK